MPTERKRRRRPRQRDRDPKHYTASFRIHPELDRALEVRCAALGITKRQAATEAFERWLAPRHTPENGPRLREVSDEELDRRALNLESIERAGREEDWAA